MKEIYSSLMEKHKNGEANTERDIKNAILIYKELKYVIDNGRSFLEKIQTDTDAGGGCGTQGAA